MERKRLLIVEDDPAVSKVLARVFAREGYDVTTAPNGARGLEVLRERRVDGMITDMNMPRVGGRELCETLVSEGCPLPGFILVVTSRSGPDERQWVSSFPHASLVEKPVSPRHLLQIVRERTAELEGREAA